jgi:uncharacterized membrane protein
MIPKDDAIPMDCSVDEALKMVISGGAIVTAIPQLGDTEGGTDGTGRTS